MSLERRDNRPFLVVFHGGTGGGVGCTSAIANVGYLLAERGRRVLLWDLDLRTPDLEDFAPFDELGSSGGFLSVLQRALDSPEEAWEGLEETLLQAVVRVPLLRRRTAAEGGALSLLPARGSARPEVTALMADVDWLGLARDEEERGSKLWRWLCSRVEQLASDDRGRPSYVLIDLSTGYSALTKMIVAHLADMVVAISRPTPSSVAATHQGLELLGRSHEAVREKTLPSCLVAAPVPEGSTLTNPSSADEPQIALRIPLVSSCMTADAVVAAGPSPSTDHQKLIGAYKLLAFELIDRHPSESKPEKLEASSALSFARDPSPSVFLRLAQCRLESATEGHSEADVQATRRDLWRGASKLRQHGHPRSAALLAGAAELSGEYLASTLQSLAATDPNQGYLGLLRAFTYKIEEYEALEPLRVAIEAMKKPCATDPWYWAARFTLDEGEVAQAAEFLRRGVEGVDLPSEDNPYRPGNGFSPKVFLGREGVLAPLGRGRGVHAISSLPREGCTWVLKMLQHRLQGPGNDGDGRPGGGACYLDGKDAARRLRATGQPGHFLHLLCARLADHLAQPLVRPGTPEELISTCNLPENRQRLRDTALLIDDLDLCLDAWRALDDNAESVLRALFGRLPLKLVVFTYHDESIMRFATYESILSGLCIHHQLKNERQLALDHVREVIQPTTADFPEGPSFAIAQALLWGWKHLQLIRRKTD